MSALSYDKPNRLTGATFAEQLSAGSWTAENRYGLVSVAYDRDGNITSLKRNGPIDLCSNGQPTYGLIDDLQYRKGDEPNRIAAITDRAGERGYDNSRGPDFDYDANGNVTATRGFTVSYNLLILTRGGFCSRQNPPGQYNTGIAGFVSDKTKRSPV